MKEQQEIHIPDRKSSEQRANALTETKKVGPITEPEEMQPKEAMEQAAKSLTELGVEHFDAQHYEEALEYFTHALAENPNDKGLWTAYGITLNHLGRYSESLHYFQVALEEGGVHYEEALLNRGLAWTRLEKYEQALRDFTTVLINNIQHGKALHYKGNALLFSGQTPFAISSYLQALNYDSQNSEIWYNLGCAFQKLTFYEYANCCFAQTLHFNPHHINALTNTAHGYFSLEKYEEAISFFILAIKTSPKDVGTWTNLGITYEKLKLEAEALNSYNQALKISDYAPAKTNQERLASIVNPHTLADQKTHAEKSIIKIVSPNTRRFLIELQEEWAIYKMQQLKVSLWKEIPPSRPPKPVFFLHKEEEIDLEKKPNASLSQAVSRGDLKAFMDDQQCSEDNSSAAAENLPS